MEKENSGAIDINRLKKRLEINEVRGALYSLFHYTNTQSLAKIVSGNSIRLSRMDQMNDGTERFPNADKTYAFCLSAVPTENVAMWISYGIPRKDAIRIRFSGKIIKSLCETKNITVYPVVGDVVDLDNPILGVASLHYVGYVSRTGNRVHVKDRIYEVSVDEKISSKENWLMERCGSFIKRLGWRHEQEIRIVVKLPRKIDAKKVQLDFSKVVKSMLTYKPRKRKDSNGMPSVIIGPWGNRERFIEEFKKNVRAKNDDINYFLSNAYEENGIIRESEFHEKIKLGHCGRCKKTSCDCVYHE